MVLNQGLKTKLSEKTAKNYWTFTALKKFCVRVCIK